MECQPLCKVAKRNNCTDWLVAAINGKWEGRTLFSPTGTSKLWSWPIFTSEWWSWPAFHRGSYSLNFTVTLSTDILYKTFSTFEQNFFQFPLSPLSPLFYAHNFLHFHSGAFSVLKSYFGTEQATLRTFLVFPMEGHEVAAPLHQPMTCN